MVSPWLSEKYALLLNKKSEAGLDVRLITTNDYQSQGHLRAIRAIASKKSFPVAITLIGVGFIILFKGIIGLVLFFIIGAIIVKHLMYKPKQKVKLTVKNKETDFVHSKIYIIDSKAMVSSANLTISGLWKNTETLVVFDKPSFVDEIAKTYEELEK